MSQIEEQQGTNAPKTTLSTEASETANPSVEDAKYLLVDDNKVNIKLMSNIFNKLGLKYQVAWNGEEALNMYKAHPERCKMILMDTSMPVMDGLRATTLIRSYESENELQPAVIVALVASNLESEKQRLVEKFGMSTTLRKPFKIEALQEVLDNWPV
ncbi:related to two-component response regulator [Fusarium torulosum]|uniref:Related to two-component response regulator n=1 Tax=Fusarium torulosum TaxID=33205 RepID=A0AAE8LXT4_9HYPO|nr:related to two-component response regulator [Fusarium torulosum]